ncbi:MAG: WYL domain-containing protein [Deltaproteobacteria bacterium]|nr:WYL domain-containing protein [Deltaproteobacteria bacterium]
MGARRPEETVARVLGVLLAQRMLRQSELARQAEVTGETAAKVLGDLKNGGLPLTRELEGRAVIWSVPDGWFPNGVLFEGDDAGQLLRLLLRLPSGGVRDAFIERIKAASLSAREVSRSVGAVRPAAVEAQRDGASRFRSVIEEAIVRARAIELKYHGTKDLEGHWRTVSPQTVVGASRPTLIAWDHRKSALRTFRVDRVQNVMDVEGIAYVRVDESRIDAEVSESFNGYCGGELREVSMLIDHDAWAIVEHNLPFIAQRIEHTNRGVRVVAKNRGGEVMNRFLLAYGARMTVETPRVRDEVLRLAKQTVERLASTGGPSPRKRTPG